MTRPAFTDNLLLIHSPHTHTHTHKMAKTLSSLQQFLHPALNNPPLNSFSQLHPHSLYYNQNKNPTNTNSELTNTTIPSLLQPMSSSNMFSYQKLRKLPKSTDAEHEEEQHGRTPRRSRHWLRLRRRRWARPRVRIAGLKRSVKRKAKQVRSKVREIVRRLKEGRAHVGDLFAGNYMFMQVCPAPASGPTPLKSFLPAAGPYLYGAATRQPSCSFNLPARVVS